jgi:hypothetical protein
MAWAKTVFAGGLGYPFAFEMIPIWRVIEGGPGLLLHALAVTATLLVIALAACAVPRRGEETTVVRASWWLILFAVLPVLLYLVKRISTPPHYFIVSLPAVLMLAGIGLDRSLARGETGARRAAGTSLLFIAGAGVVLVTTVLMAVRRSGGTPGDYGLTYRVQRDAAAILIESKVSPRNVDARYTRDGSIGVLYLMGTGSSGISFVPGRRAQIVDRQLMPGLDCPGAGTMLLDRRVGPLTLCVFERDKDDA